MEHWFKFDADKLYEELKKKEEQQKDTDDERRSSRVQQEPSMVGST